VKTLKQLQDDLLEAAMVTAAYTQTVDPSSLPPQIVMPLGLQLIAAKKLANFEIDSAGGPVEYVMQEMLKAGVLDNDETM
jgi:hypothetical protein